MSSKSFYGLVGVCLHYNFSWSDNHFFWQYSVGQTRFRLMYPGTVWCTKMLQIAIHCYQYKDFNHRCKGGYILGKTKLNGPVSLPITASYSLPPAWLTMRPVPAKKDSTSGMRNYWQNCTSLHWIPYILDRRQLTLTHQATFQISRQFRFPWQLAENGWLEIGLYNHKLRDGFPLWIMHNLSLLIGSAFSFLPSRAITSSRKRHLMISMMVEVTSET